MCISEWTQFKVLNEIWKSWIPYLTPTVETSLTKSWGFELLMNTDHNALWFSKSIKSVWERSSSHETFYLASIGSCFGSFFRFHFFYQFSSSLIRSIRKFDDENFYPKIHYLVICVHSQNIFSVIANLPSLQHNVGSLIKVSFVSQPSYLILYITEF